MFTSEKVMLNIMDTFEAEDVVVSVRFAGSVLDTPGSGLVTTRTKGSQHSGPGTDLVVWV